MNPGKSSKALDQHTPSGMSRRQRPSQRRGLLHRRVRPAECCSYERQRCCCDHPVTAAPTSLPARYRPVMTAPARPPQKEDVLLALAIHSIIYAPCIIYTLSHDTDVPVTRVALFSLHCYRIYIVQLVLPGGLCRLGRMGCFGFPLPPDSSSSHIKFSRHLGGTALR